MPLVLDENGLQIQTLEEIKGEIEADHRLIFGDNVDLRPNEPFGQMIGIYSEREAAVQQVVQKVYSARDPGAAAGVQLDGLGALTGSSRDAATRSRAAGLVTGVAGTLIDTTVSDKLVRLIATQTEWKLVDGPYVIGGGGTVAVTIEAVLAGPTDALATGPGGWDIVTIVAGWTSFETTADADPVGRAIQSDEEFENDRQLELLDLGNDIAAIKASVLQVDGVVTVKVFENLTLVPDAIGIPGKAFETLVGDDGGSADDTAMGDAIFNDTPPGAEAFGSVSVLVDDGVGGTIDIGFTRPTDVPVWLSIEVTRTGAEDPYPSDGDALIAAAVLEFAEANHASGDDVIPDFFIGTVYDAVGNKSIVNVAVKTSTVSFAAATDAVLPIAARELAKFDSTRIEVVQL